jgi:hypothetical protein
MAGSYTPDELARIRKADPSIKDDASAAAFLDRVAAKMGGGGPGGSKDDQDRAMIGQIMAGPSELLGALKRDVTNPETLGGLAGLGAAIVAARMGNMTPLRAAIARIVGQGVGTGVGAASEGRDPVMPALVGGATGATGESAAGIKALWNRFHGAARLQPRDVEGVRGVTNEMLQGGATIPDAPPPVQFPEGTPPEVVEAFTQSLVKRSPTGLAKTGDARFKAALTAADEMTQSTDLEFPTIGRIASADGTVTVRPMTLRQAVDRASALALEGMEEGVKRSGANATTALLKRADLLQEIDEVVRGAGHPEAADLLIAGRGTLARHGGVTRLLQDTKGGANPLTTEGTVDMAALQARLRELAQSGKLPPGEVAKLQAAIFRKGPMSVSDQPGVFETPFASLGPTGLRFGFSPHVRIQSPSFAGAPPSHPALRGPRPEPMDATLNAIGQAILRRALSGAP